ncbi:MAG: hypothetical protein NTY86_21620 [Deltaproteobacteria bacterium]|nr:hypothetical protein [Deltaproteobacteria bacterium]
MGDKSIIGPTLAHFGKGEKRLGHFEEHLNIRSERPYTDHHAYCLFYFNGSCGKCIEHCPAGAITREGHDKGKCATYVRDVSSKSIQSRFGFDTSGCGLCQVGVPCEAKIPLPGRTG